MKITVCELPDESARRARAWADLVRYLHANPTDVVVLPEMPFCEWAMFRKRSVDLAAWRATLAAHDAMMARLAELETRMVLSSRPAPNTICRTSPTAGRRAGSIAATENSRRRTRAR